MIKTEVSPHKKTVHICQEGQNNRLFTNKSRSLKKLYNLPSSVDLYQITPAPPRSATPESTPALNPSFVQPKILCQRQAKL